MMGWDRPCDTVWASRGRVLIDRRAIIILYLASLPKAESAPSVTLKDPDERENNWYKVKKAWDFEMIFKISF